MSIRNVLLVAALLARLDAATIFSNLIQPGDQYGPDSVGIGHTPGFPNPGDYLIYGVPFIPVISAQLTAIESPFGILGGPNQLQAFLMDDAGGIPGGVIESFALSVLPAPPGAFPLLTINSSVSPVLVAGHRYWFVATGGPNTFALWTLNLFQGDSVDGGASQSVIGGIAQPWSVGSGTRTGALEVFGDAVPEPTYATLVGIALLFLAIGHSPALQKACSLFRASFR